MLVLCVPGMWQKLQPHCSRVHIALFLHLLYLLFMNLNIADAESCKCNLLKHDDYITMLVSTFGEFIGM